MSYQAIVEYLNALAKIYFVSTKDKKTQLLNHAVLSTGQHRKSLIRALSSNELENHKKKWCGAKIRYSEELLLPHIKFLWVSMERISVKRMKASYADWPSFYRVNDVDNHVKFLL